jgi:hypothetical protein
MRKSRSESVQRVCDRNVPACVHDVECVRAAQVPKTPRRVHVVAASGGHRNCARDWRGLATAQGNRRWPGDGAGARKRGAPESPVFGAAENAPK